MKTYQTEPEISVEEFIKLDDAQIDYGGGALEAPKILAAWIKKQEKDIMPHDAFYQKYLVKHYGAMFLFECGRIYGIRQERARHRK